MVMYPKCGSDVIGVYEETRNGVIYTVYIFNITVVVDLEQVKRDVFSILAGILTNVPLNIVAEGTRVTSSVNIFGT